MSVGQKIPKHIGRQMASRKRRKAGRKEIAKTTQHNKVRRMNKEHKRLVSIGSVKSIEAARRLSDKINTYKKVNKL